MDKTRVEPEASLIYGLKILPRCMKCDAAIALPNPLINSQAAWGNLARGPTISVGDQIIEAFLRAAKEHAETCTGWK